MECINSINSTPRSYHARVYMHVRGNHASHENDERIYNYLQRRKFVRVGGSMEIYVLNNNEYIVERRA